MKIQKELKGNPLLEKLPEVPKIIPAQHPNSSMRTPQEQVQMQVLLKEQTQVEQHCLDQIQQAPVSVALILAVCIRRSNSGGLKTSWQVFHLALRFTLGSRDNTIRTRFLHTVCGPMILI